MRAACAVFVLALTLAGCTEVEEKETHGYEPSKLTELKGDAKRVTVTAEGARRVALRRAAAGRAARGRTIVPYGALLYDKEGKTSLYVAKTPLTFERVQVDVERIEGNRALLRRGPAAGTQVVTQGASEVYGTELEIAAG
jgi:hypothetical protein